MSDTETAMTPKQLLTRLLKLMETSDTVDDFTPEKISKTFGVPLEKFFFDNAPPLLLTDSDKKSIPNGINV